MPKEYPIKIEEGESGVWFATSETEPPMFLSCLSFDELMVQLPIILRRIIQPQTK